MPIIFARPQEVCFPTAPGLTNPSLIKKLRDKLNTSRALTQSTHDRFPEASKRYGTAAGQMRICKVIKYDAGLYRGLAGDWVKPRVPTPNRNHPPNRIQPPTATNMGASPILPFPDGQRLAGSKRLCVPYLSPVLHALGKPQPADNYLQRIPRWRAPLPLRFAKYSRGARGQTASAAVTGRPGGTR